MDDSRLEDWYERYGPQLHRRCMAILGDEEWAWDALQDVFVQAARNLHRFEGRAAPSTWLYRISTNVCLNLLRRRRVRDGQGRIDIEALDRIRDAVGDGRHAERAALVRELLDRFEPRVQACAIHFYVDEMSKAEVARVTGLSVPTVRKYIRQFTERSRKILAETLDERAAAGGAS